MKKKLLSVLLSAVIITSLVGCGGKTDATQPSADGEQTSVENQTLKVAALEGGYGAELWKEVAAAFEDIHPGVTVELTVDKKLEDVISPSMKAGEYPDAVHLATGRGHDVLDW